MMPPQAAEIFAFEKKTLIRKLIDIVDIANDIRVKNTTTGLVLVKISPFVATTTKRNAGIMKNNRLVMNQDAQ